MEAKVNFVAVGVFVIVLSLALIGGVLWLTSGKYYRVTYDTYVTYMSDSVAGLNLNAPVRYRGVDVGRVRGIALAPNDVERVQVTMDIARGTPIKEDTVAMLQTQGLTGIAFVDLAAGYRDSPPLKAKAGEEYPVIQSAPSLMRRLEASVPQLLANLSRLSESLGAVIDEDNRRALKGTLADLEVLSRTLAGRSASIDASLRNLELLSRTLAARSGTIDAGLAAAAEAAQNAARLTDRLPGLAQRVERSAEAFDRMTGQVAGAGASASALLDSARADVRQFTTETLPEARELVAELRNLTATLQRVADRVESNPSVLLYGRPQPRPGPGE